MSTPIYQPLESSSETRILKLEPAKNYDDEVIVSLVHISLERPPVYEALSYVWKNSGYSSAAANNNGNSEKIHASLYNTETKETIFIDMTFEEMRQSPFEQFRRSYYQLGGHKPDVQITCDGQKVTIGAELNEALRRIRLEEKQRLIWIDALCVNQLDMKERNQHVQKMGEIYSKAETVLIWLGEYLSDAYLGLETIIKLCEKITTFEEKAKYSSMGAVRDIFLADPEVKTLRWDCLSDMLNRTWFGRVWVLQEVVNSKRATVIATNCQFDWDLFAGVICWLRFNDVDSPLYAKGEVNSIQTIMMMMRLSELKRKGNTDKYPLPSLLKVLRDSRGCKSTMPVDKVYGVLGMVSEEEASAIEINYSLDPAELFTGVATTELLGKTGLDILYLCTKSPNDSDVRAPSWVPDWTQPCHHEALSTLQYKCSAAGSSRPSFRIEGKTLIVQGRVLDTIQGVELCRKIPKGAKGAEYDQEKLKGEYFWENQKQQFEEYFENASMASTEWLTNAMSVAFPDKTITEESHEMFWRSFCCNQTTDGKIPPPDWADYFDAFVMCITRPKDELQSMNERQINEIHLRMTRFMYSFGSWCYNRRFYRSESGRFGWAPDQARPGDKLCVLDGLAVPVILRPKEGNFELIGDVYVYGIMDGEVMNMNLEARDINIV